MKSLGHKRDHTKKWEDRLLLVGVFFLVLTSLWFLVKNRPAKTKFEPAQSLFYCDAEQVEGDLFVTKGRTFLKGEWQSSEQAHSGNFSCKIPKSEGIQYALTTNWDGIKGGQLWQVAIWHFRQPSARAKLVIKGVDAPDLYIESGVSVARVGDWEQFQVSLFIPYENVPNELQAYVYTEGKFTHYVDDMIISQPDVVAGERAGIVHLGLNIDSKSMRVLEKKRKEALAAGLLIQGKKDWVDAQMSDSNRVFPVKLRLKGDWTDHLQGKKWSFRIALKKGRSWNRLKTFSVHTPSTRYHLHEWLLHEFWKREGVLTTYYDFVRLGLNDKELGLYALEEHFEKQLLERQHRREGPILKLSEEGFWLGINRQLANHGYQKQDDLMAIMERKNAPTKVFNEKTIRKNPTLDAAWKTASILLEGFQQGTLGVEDVFDLDKLAKYYAIADLFNAHHALTWHNQRFYFNPVLGKLEPIGFDGFGAKPERRYRLLGEGGVSDDNPYFHQLLGNKRFLTLYYRYLFQYSTAAYFNDFIQEVRPKWAALLPLIQSEFKDYQYTLSDFLEEAKYVHSLLLPFDDFSVSAQRIIGEDSMIIGNKHALAIRVIGFGIQKNVLSDSVNLWLSGRPSRRYQRRIDRDTLLGDYPLNPYLYQDVQQHQFPMTVVKIAAHDNARYVFYKLPGVDRVFHTKIGKISRGDTHLFIKNRKGNIGDFIGKYYRLEGKKIFFLSGELDIEKPIIIPEGYQVIFSEGGTCNLIKGAYILSYSPIIAHGTEGQPVLFQSSDATGRGLSVLQPKTPSNLNYVIFDGQQSFVGHGQAMSGAVNFYEAAVNFDHCVFRNNHCEDALNVIRSTFVMKNSVFSNTEGDGLDSDFSKGEIFNTRFTHIGNDALDCSGSIITVKDVEIDNCGDKGVSAGEESDLSIFNAVVSNASIAFASKDLSVLFLKNIKIKQCKQGFVAFEKKTEYGSAYIYVDGYESDGVDRLKAVGAGSEIEIQ